MKFTKRMVKKMVVLAACAVVSLSSAVVYKPKIETFAKDKNENYSEINTADAEDLSNLTYSGYYYSAINDGFIYIEKPANGTGEYDCVFYKVYMGNNKYVSTTASAYRRTTAVILQSGTKIGTFTFTAGSNDPETCDMYYYNNKYDHNITIFVHGVPYEKAL